MFLVSGKLKLGVSIDKRKIGIVSENGKLKTCDLERDQLTKAVTCLALSPFQEQLAVGFNDGTLQVWDIQSAKVVFRGKLEGSCISLAFSMSSLFAAEERTGKVCEWDIIRSIEKSGFIADDQGLTCIATRQEEKSETALLATARTSIIVWKDGKKVSRYSGHSAHISGLAFLKGGAVASSTNQDNYISIWPAGAKKARYPLLTLSCSEPIRSFSLGQRLFEGDEGSLVALSNSSTKCFVWRIPSLSEDSENSVCACSSVVATDNILLGCDFVVDKPGTIVCMEQSKNDINLTLTKVDLLDAAAANGLRSDVKLQNGHHLADNSVLDLGIKAKLKRLDLASTVVKNDTDVKRIRAVSNASNEDDRPLMSKLIEYSARLEHAQTPYVGTSKQVSSSSLSVALDQALQTEDKDKIEAVLQTGDMEIVSQTVQRLSSLKVPALIRELSVRLQGKPGRAPHLLIWISAIMDHHAALLTTDTTSREALKSMYAIADLRVQVFDRLLRLKGRLDLVLARSSSYASSALTFSNRPLLVVDGTKD